MKRNELLVLTIVAWSMGLMADRVAAQPSVIVEVSAGDMDRANIPVSVQLPEMFREARSVFMQRLDTSQEVVTQRSEDDPASITWVLTSRLARGQVRRYRVLASNIAKPAEEFVTCRDTGTALAMSVSHRPVLTYRTAVVMPPGDLDPVFQRSGFLHPVQTPSGRIVTADFPVDHAHQHGIFFAWKQTQFEGQPVDFWNQADRTGTVEHVAIERVVNGPVFAEFDVTLRHVALTAGGPRPALDEEWTVRVYSHRDVFVFDLTSRQQCASDSPLKLLEYHYGGMGYRGPVEWLGTESGFAMLTSDGKDRIAGNQSRPLWVDCTGPIRGQPCGIRVIQHPDNFRFPQPVRLHPTKPYFVFSPEGLGEFTIEPEQTYESRYRYVLFDGPPSASAAQLAEDFVHPPVVRIVE